MKHIRVAISLFLVVSVAAVIVEGAVETANAPRIPSELTTAVGSQPKLPEECFECWEGLIAEFDTAKSLTHHSRAQDTAGRSHLITAIVQHGTRVPRRAVLRLRHGRCFFQLAEGLHGRCGETRLFNWRKMQLCPRAAVLTASGRTGSRISRMPQSSTQRTRQGGSTRRPHTRMQRPERLRQR